eukprot:1056874-Amphidinium_carterae.1
MRRTRKRSTFGAGKFWERITVGGLCEHPLTATHATLPNACTISVTSSTVAQGTICHRSKTEHVILLKYAQNGS